MWWYMLFGRLMLLGASQFEASPANSSQDLVFKIIKPKWTGGMTQAAECILCKWEALSSNSNPTKKKKKRAGM
jgi:hypothetical protein